MRPVNCRPASICQNFPSQHYFEKIARRDQLVGTSSIWLSLSSCPCPELSTSLTYTHLNNVTVLDRTRRAHKFFAPLHFCIAGIAKFESQAGTTTLPVRQRLSNRQMHCLPVFSYDSTFQFRELEDVFIVDCSSTPDKISLEAPSDFTGAVSLPKAGSGYVMTWIMLLISLDQYATLSNRNFVTYVVRLCDFDPQVVGDSFGLQTTLLADRSVKSPDLSHT